MNKIHNPFEDINCKLDNIEKKVDLLLRKVGKVDLYDEFNVEGLHKAAKILGRSEKTLTNKIEKGDVLKENIHYRISDGGRYFFSKGALLEIKGLI